MQSFKQFRFAALAIATAVTTLATSSAALAADGVRRWGRRVLRLRLFSTSCEQGDEEGCRKKARRPRPPLAESNELPISFRGVN